MTDVTQIPLDQRELKERLLALQKEKEARQGDDPLRLWKPHGGQMPFVDACFSRKHSECWMIAANRSGKSDAGAYIGATLARYGHDNGKRNRYDNGRLVVNDRSTSGWVVALDFPTSRDVIQPKYFDNDFVSPGQTHAPFIPEHEIAAWKREDQILKLHNGSLIGFKSAESGRKKFQGADKDWIHFDEEPPKDIYQESAIRVGARPLFIFGTCTLLPPEGSVGGVSWMFDDVIRRWQAGELPDHILFGCSIYDNPYIPRDEIRRLENLYPEGSVQRRIRLEGEWLPGLAGARAYPAFERSIHVKEQPSWNPRRPLCWTLDFNVEPMCSLIGSIDWVHGAPLYRIHKELVLDEGSIDDMVDMFYTTASKHSAEIYIYGDSTSKNRSRQTGKSDYALILNGLKQIGIPLRMKVPDSNPHVPDRINAVNAMLRDNTGMVGMEIDPSCAHLIADLEGVLRDGRGGIKKTYNRKDPYYYRTHTSDALGYWIAREAPVIVRSNRQEHSGKFPTPRYGSHHSHARNSGTKWVAR